MTLLLNIFAIIFLLVVNIGFFGQLKLYGALPNLLLLFVLIVALDKDIKNGYLYLALLAGLLLDVHAGVLFGSFSFGLLILALCLSSLAEAVVVIPSKWEYLGLVVLAATFLLHFFVWLYAYGAFRLGWVSLPLAAPFFSSRLLVEAAYNLACLYPVLRLFTWLKQMEYKYFLKYKTVR